MLTPDLAPGDSPAGLWPQDRIKHQPGARPSTRRHTNNRRLVVVGLAVGVTIALVRALVVQSFVIPTASMDPTLRAGDRVLVSRVAYRIGDVHRGDVIVFDGAGVFDPMPNLSDSPLARAGRAVASAFSLPVGSQDYVKRVIGLPGDRVVCCTSSGQLTVDGLVLSEPYVNPEDVPSDEPFDVTVPAGRLWVMGDHRSASADSRSHLSDPGRGTVPLDRVVGRVVGIYWPLPHLRVGTTGRSTGATSVHAAAQRKEPGDRVQ